ncbi:MAG: 2,3-diketo-L-gulonate transporter small permease protein YiaM [Pseudomonadota bacterium]
MIQSLLNGCCRMLEAVIAMCLAVMVVLVFGNVMLRYGFNSGITLSEELSRWLFVWMTFMGAIVALKEHGHLGTDMLVSRLGSRGKKFCLGLSQLLMLFVCWLLLKGSFEQAKVNYGSTSAVMEVSMAWLYLPGILFAVLGGLMIAIEFMRLITGKLSEQDLVMIQESEDVPHSDASK